MKLVIIFAVIASVISEKDVTEDKSLENFFDDTFFVFGQKTNYKRENPSYVNNPTYEGRRNYITPDYKPLYQNEPRLYHSGKNQNRKYSEQNPSVHSQSSIESDKDSAYTEPKYDEPTHVKDNSDYQKYQPSYSTLSYENQLINQYKSEENTYSFVYKVKNDNSQTHAHEQKSDGKTVTGSYRVDLPDGRIQIVSYVADDNGYRADVRYEGKSLEYTPSVAYKKVYTQKQSPIATPDYSPLDYKTEKNHQEYTANTAETYPKKPLEPPVTEYSVKDDYHAKELTYQAPLNRGSVVYEHAKSSPEPEVYSYREPSIAVPDSYSLNREEYNPEAKEIEYNTASRAETYPEKNPSEPPSTEYLVKNDYHKKESTYQASPRRGSVVYNPNESEIEWHREHRPRKSPRISRPTKIIDKPMIEKELAQSHQEIINKVNEFESDSKTATEKSTLESTRSPKNIKGSEDFISQFISFQEKIDADYDDVTEKTIEILNVPRWNSRNIERLPARAIAEEKITRVRNPVIEVAENSRKSPVFRTSSNRQSIVNELTQEEKKDGREPNFGLAKSRSTTSKPSLEVITQQPLQETVGIEQSTKQDIKEKTTNGIDKSIYSILRPKMIKPHIFERPSIVTEENSPLPDSVTQNLEILNSNDKILDNVEYRRPTKPNKGFHYTPTLKPRVSSFTPDSITTTTKLPTKVYHFTSTTSKPSVDYLTSDSTPTTAKPNRAYTFASRTPKPRVSYNTPDLTSTSTEPNQLHHFTPTTTIPKVYYFTPDSTPATTLPKVYYFTPINEESEKPAEPEPILDQFSEIVESPESKFEELLFETPWEDEPADTSIASETPVEDASVTVAGGTYEISEASDATHNPLYEVSKSSETAVDLDTAIEDLLFETAWENEKDYSVTVTTKDISPQDNIGPQSLPLIQKENISNLESRNTFGNGVLYGGNGKITVHKP